MARLARLLKVGSMTDAMGVFVTAMLFQKGLGLARVFLFLYLMKEARAQYGLWGVGMMVFTVAGRFMSLGVNQGLARYVSYYEAGGLLEAFYRRLRRCAAILILITGAIAAGQYAFVAALLFSSLVNVVIFFRIIEIGFFEPFADHHEAPELPRREAPLGMVISLMAVAVGLIVLGIFTKEIVTHIIQFAIPEGIA